MESATDPWNINPSDLHKGSINVDAYLGFGGSDSLGYSGDPNSVALGQEDFEKLLGLECDDVDNLLSQELKDLDIPLMPKASRNPSSNGDGIGSGGNSFVYNECTEDPYSLNRYNAHKRAPSGTAIFGFHNHNKTLSISNWQKTIYDAQQQRQAELLPNEENADGSLGQVLLKQQEELRVALERQQEVNKKLEEQLRANRLQQERLQRVLDEQEVTAYKLASENPSPQSARTPASKGTTGNDTNIIVTSNSNNGGYKFPPPLIPSSYPAGTHTSINGSPSRRASRKRPSAPDNLPEGIHQDDEEEDVAMVNYLRPEIEQEDIVADSSHFLEKRNSQLNLGNAYLPPEQARSPIGKPILHHSKKESTISTVSTIPQRLDDNDNSDIESGGFVGLGIQSLHARRSPKNYSLRPPPIDVMPAIPGSSGNTPITKQPQLPQKHIFQHTPVKNSTQHPPAPLPSHPQNYYGGNDNPFKDPIATPQLKPPSVHSSRRNSGYSTDYHEVLGNRKEQDLDAVEEPESRFIIAKTPSPVLKSQGHFEGSSPQYDTSNLSPLKITRKPTTLPRGSIDKYVKELPDKLFECQYHECGKIFKRRYNIRSHIQTHLEDRPYVCDFEGCDKAFVRNHDLVRHKKSHAEKCYACPCGKKFNREDALIVHRSRLICSGGKKYENVVIKKSPRRRGRPKKEGYGSTQSSPVKETVERSHDGYLIYKMEEQLRNEMEECGLLRPPQRSAVTNASLLLSPSPSSGTSDLGSPKYEIKEPEKRM